MDCDNVEWKYDVGTRFSAGGEGWEIIKRSSSCDFRLDKHKHSVPSYLIRSSQDEYERWMDEEDLEGYL